MAPHPHVNDPRHWHDRAAEMRALADAMATVESKAMMLRLADDYDKLGDRAEARRCDKDSKRNSHDH